MIQELKFSCPKEPHLGRLFAIPSVRNVYLLLSTSRPLCLSCVISLAFRKAVKQQLNAIHCLILKHRILSVQFVDSTHEVWDKHTWFSLTIFFQLCLDILLLPRFRSFSFNMQAPACRPTCSNPKVLHTKDSASLSLQLLSQLKGRIWKGVS